MSPRKLTLPDAPHLTDRAGDGRLHAPSAERNQAAIVKILMRHAPAAGHGFEIASGTGQHIAAFARALPALTWQPSDVDPARLASIAAWQKHAGHTNLLPPVRFDAITDDWPVSGPDLVVLINLLHLITHDAAEKIVASVGRAMKSGGIFLLYGPFTRNGGFASDGDCDFHRSLQAQDPEIGYKDSAEIRQWFRNSGLELVEMVEMPATNLTWILRKP